MLTNIVGIPAEPEALPLDAPVSVAFEPRATSSAGVPPGRRPMSSMHHGNVAVIGAAETTGLGTLPGMSMIELHADAAHNALADVGLTPVDIDGIATAGPLPMEVSHHPGIMPRDVRHVRHPGGGPPVARRGSGAGPRRPG